MKFKEYLEESATDEELLATIMQFGWDDTKPIPVRGGGTSVTMNGGDGKRYNYIVYNGVATEYVESKPKSKKYNATKKVFKKEKDLKARVRAVVDGL